MLHQAQALSNRACKLFISVVMLGKVPENTHMPLLLCRVGLHECQPLPDKFNVAARSDLWVEVGMGGALFRERGQLGGLGVPAGGGFQVIGRALTQRLLSVRYRDDRPPWQAALALLQRLYMSPHAGTHTACSCLQAWRQMRTTACHCWIMYKS